MSERHIESTRQRLRARLTAVLVGACIAAATFPSARVDWLSTPERVAPGVEFYTSTDRSLVDLEGPIAVYLLRLDPRRTRLASVLSNDEVAGAEPVLPIAERHHAVAAINAGFFNMRTGEPAGLLKVDRELVSDTTLARGAVAIASPPRGTTKLAFDQVSVRVALRFSRDRQEWRVPVDGVDTTRARGKLMMYTPSYHADTDTAANGIEWVLKGRPLKVVQIRRDAGRTPIPRDGVVLSYGGLDPPESLRALVKGQRVAIEMTWTAVNGLRSERLEEADHIVNGAGLLRVRGRILDDWTVERFTGPGFVETRHPRTVIGVDRTGFIWLGAIDGRQPDYSVGMTFPELQRLCDRLALVDALNLDGGGSTTMVVKGRIVNRPSDVTGPRPVSDALIVVPR